MSRGTSRLLGSLIRFGVVGTVSISSQASLFFFLANYAGFSGFTANAIGYAVSLLISYYGQSQWTFSDQKDRSILRFLAIAILSFILGSGGALLIVDWARASPLWVLPIILLVIPGMSFLMMRHWAFRNLPPERQVTGTS
jgi:putative flippase GtrA